MDGCSRMDVTQSEGDLPDFNQSEHQKRHQYTHPAFKLVLHLQILFYCKIKTSNAQSQNTCNMAMVQIWQLAQLPYCCWCQRIKCDTFVFYIFSKCLVFKTILVFQLNVFKSLFCKKKQLSESCLTRRSILEKFSSLNPH